MDLKRCSQCGQDKPHNDFYKDKQNKSGFSGKCKNCTKENGRIYYRANKNSINNKQKEWRKNNPAAALAITLKFKHNTTMSELLETYGNVCNICSVSFSESRMHIDHDHNCCPPKNSCLNCRRGLLCANCNIALGHLRDDTSLLRKAIEYLERVKK